jgi:hypothetical protein
MESFTKLFGSLLVFVYHCFDRIVINGYLGSYPKSVISVRRAAAAGHNSDRWLR